MSISRLIPAAAAVACLAAVPATSDAATPCVSSTPSTAAFPHTPTQPLVAQVTSVNIAIDAACNLTITDTVNNRSNGLLPGDTLSWYLDTDGNPSTGDQRFAGADVAILLLGSNGTPMLVPATNGTLDSTQATAVTRVNFGFTANLGALSAVPGNIAMMASSQYRGIQSYSDFIPPVTASGAATVSFAATFATIAPAAPRDAGRACISNVAGQHAGLRSSKGR